MYKHAPYVLNSSDLANEIVNFVENTDLKTLFNIYKAVFPEDKITADWNTNTFVLET